MGEATTHERPWWHRWYLWFGLPLILGALTASFLIPQPVIGVIYLSEAIAEPSARDLIAQLDYARTHPEVRAVVLVLDSPGGTVTDTEAVYFELVRLRRHKPVVALARGLTASGAYYLAVGTDTILASPSAIVGNVGVITQLPPSPQVSEDIVSTGPYKLWGGPRDSFLRRMEAIKQAFYQAVQAGRGDRLKIGPETLLRGEVWSGTEAARLGLVDGLGGLTEAVEKAAELAKVANYRVADLRALAGLPEPETFSFFLETPAGGLTPYPREWGIYLLYVPPVEGSLP